MDEKLKYSLIRGDLTENQSIWSRYKSNRCEVNDILNTFLFSSDTKNASGS